MMPTKAPEKCLPSTGNVGGEVAVKENQFTRHGYYFAGWNTKADGTGTAYDAR